MTDTTFVTGVTVIEAAWLNEVNNLVHTIFGNPSTAAAARASINAASTSELTTAIAAHAATTSSHGVNGDIVGTNSAQTLINKTLVVANNTVTTASSGNLVATELNAALAELDGQDTTIQTNLDNHIADAVAAHAASAISNTPAGNIAATDIQTAINELDTEKAAQTTTLIAGIGISGGGDLSANRTFDLDINGLTSETVVDTTADYVAMYDASAAAIRKVLVGNLPVYLPLLHVQDQKTSGTNGGSSVSGTQTRTLNTVVTNEISGASLSSNQITLPAGTYEILASAPAWATGASQVYLYDTTGIATLLVGTTEFTSGGTPLAQTRSFVTGRFTLSTSSVLELRHYTSSANAADGLGVAASSGQGEVYSDVQIRKVS